MSEQEQAKTVRAGEKNRYRFNVQGNQASKTSCKSKAAKLEDEIFDVVTSTTLQSSASY